MAQTKRGTSRERVDARTNGDEGWLSALVTALNLMSPSGLSGLSDAFKLCVENCQRDICVTVYREWVKKITKFTKSTYRSFVACRLTVPSSQRKSVSAPPLISVHALRSISSRLPNLQCCHTVA